MSAPKKGCFFLMGLLAMFGHTGCEALRDHPKNIREFPEPWQILEPGTPSDPPPRVEILVHGQGPVVETGDLVQVHAKGWSASTGRWYEFGDWWIWIAFRSSKETAFYSYSPTIAAGLLNLRQGSELKILDASPEGGDYGSAGELRPNPFGDRAYYSWRKNTQDSLSVLPPKASEGYSVLEIKRVCKGQAKYRTVRLFDDSPVRTGSGFKTKVTREPRELWIDEAKIEATCGDGRKAVFQYGPTGSKSGGRPNFVVTGYFDDWLYEAWKKLDIGVQFEGNRPPQAREDKFETQVDKPVRIDVLANDRDTEENKLSARITKNPEHGKLADNPDGSWTYTPNPGWSGTDYFKYRASDGLVESAETLADVRVVKRD